MIFKKIKGIFHHQLVMNSSEIIKAIQSRFGISQQNMSELLSILQTSMINSGHAKSSKSGNIFFGSTSEREM